MIDKDKLREYAEDEINRMPDDVDDCVALRKCVSISYLYAYHYGRDRFIDHPKAEFKTLGDYLQHREFHDFFQRIKAQNIVDKIIAVRSTRNRADYQLQEDFNKKQVVFHMKNIESLINMMDKISAP